MRQKGRKDKKEEVYIKQAQGIGEYPYYADKNVSEGNKNKGSK